MHEIRATIPAECVEEAARLAHAAGIARVSVSDTFVHGPNLRRRVLSVETSTPKARAYVEAFLGSPVLSSVDYALTSREVRAIVNDESREALTQPMSEPFPDVIQDLWQLSHVTVSYIARAASGAALLATGILENNSIAIVTAALFLPFLAPLLALSFGLWDRDPRLVRQGFRAVGVSILLAIAAGALAGWIEGAPLPSPGFKSPLNSLVISALLGLAAGLSNADDTGRRYLIGVAAAVQLATFPVWLGAALILGKTAHSILYPAAAGWAISFITIGGSAIAAFAILQLRGGRGWSAPHSGHVADR